MKNFRLWAILALVLAVTGASLWAWWNYDLRWRPHVIKRHQAEIAAILEKAGWVSPGLTGPKLYLVSVRDCAACGQFRDQEFAGLQEAGVDTRVIAIAPADVNGVPKSTATERATVAELWLNRSWKLMEAWQAAPADAWTAPGLPPADGDMARTAVVEVGRKTAEDLRPLLKANGVTFAYPVLVWWTKDGEMRACACEKPQTYRFVRQDLAGKP